MISCENYRAGRAACQYRTIYQSLLFPSILLASKQGIVMITPKHLVFSLGLIVCFSASAQDKQMVDVGDHKLMALVSGSGQYTVVFESGFGNDLSIWRLVQPLVSEYATTVTYSRAGYPGSEEGPVPRTISQVNLELHNLLAELDLPPPYILVGHSLGGIFVRSFYATYPNEVLGMVLVDSSHERQFLSLLELDPDFDPWTEGYAMLESREGVSEGMRGELIDFLEISKTGILPAMRTMENLPLYVFTSGMLLEEDESIANSPAGKQVSIDLHSEFMEGVTNGGHIITQQSDHFIQLREPELINWAVERIVATLGE